MLLDTGNHVFLWKGPTASIIEVKFAAKSAEVRSEIGRATRLDLFCLGTFSCTFNIYAHVNRIDRVNCV